MPEMPVRASTVVAENFDDLSKVPFPTTVLTVSSVWPECEFEGCTNRTSFMRRDRFGEMHRSCTDCQETLDLWIRIHNGWEEDDAEVHGEVEG